MSYPSDLPVNTPPLPKKDLSDTLYHIMNLWYYDAYEETSKQLWKSQALVQFWETRYKEMRNSRDRLRASNRIQQRRIGELHDTIHVKDRFIREIFEQFPDVRAQHEFQLAQFNQDMEDSEEDTEEEDLLDLRVRRRLAF